MDHWGHGGLGHVTVGAALGGYRLFRKIKSARRWNWREQQACMGALPWDGVEPVESLWVRIRGRPMRAMMW